MHVVRCRSTLSALVVMDVHARDVVEQLANEEIEGQPGHFSWLSQLRMYSEVRATGPLLPCNQEVSLGLGKAGFVIVQPSKLDANECQSGLFCGLGELTSAAVLCLNQAAVPALTRQGHGK
jgi:hypothetical protein